MLSFVLCLHPLCLSFHFIFTLLWISICILSFAWSSSFQYGTRRKGKDRWSKGWRTGSSWLNDYHEDRWYSDDGWYRSKGYGKGWWDEPETAVTGALKTLEYKQKEQEQLEKLRDGSVLSGSSADTATTVQTQLGTAAKAPDGSAFRKELQQVGKKLLDAEEKERLRLEHQKEVAAAAAHDTRCREEKLRHDEHAEALDATRQAHAKKLVSLLNARHQVASPTRSVEEYRNEAHVVSLAPLLDEAAEKENAKEDCKSRSKKAQVTYVNWCGGMKCTSCGFKRRWLKESKFGHGPLCWKCYFHLVECEEARIDYNLCCDERRTWAEACRNTCLDIGIKV